MRKKLLMLVLALTGTVMASLPVREASALGLGCGTCPEGECCPRCHVDIYTHVCVCNGPVICS